MTNTVKNFVSQSVFAHNPAVPCSGRIFICLEQFDDGLAVVSTDPAEEGRVQALLFSEWAILHTEPGTGRLKRLIEELETEDESAAGYLRMYLNRFPNFQTVSRHHADAKELNVKWLNWLHFLNVLAGNEEALRHEQARNAAEDHDYFERHARGL